MRRFHLVAIACLILFLCGCEAMLCGIAAVPIGIRDDAAQRKSAREYDPNSPLEWPAP